MSPAEVEQARHTASWLNSLATAVSTVGAVAPFVAYIAGTLPGTASLAALSGIGILCAADADEPYKQEEKSPASMGDTAREIPSFERYKLQEWLTYITNEIHKNFSPLFQPAIPNEVKDFFRDRIIGKFKYIDGKLAGNDYLTGEQFTVADGYLFVMLTWADRTGMDISSLRNLIEFKARIGARPKVQEADERSLSEGGLSTVDQLRLLDDLFMPPPSSAVGGRRTSRS